MYFSNVSKKLALPYGDSSLNLSQSIYHYGADTNLPFVIPNIGHTMNTRQTVSLNQVVTSTFNVQALDTNTIDLYVHAEKFPITENRFIPKIGLEKKLDFLFPPMQIIFT